MERVVDCCRLLNTESDLLLDATLTQGSNMFFSVQSFLSLWYFSTRILNALDSISPSGAAAQRDSLDESSTSSQNEWK